MASRVSLSTIVDLLSNDLTKVDAIFLVTPGGKLGNGNPW